MINERIMELINVISNGNKRAFSRLVEVNPTVIENIVGTRKGKPGYDLLEKISFAIENINTDWLLTGRGQMLRNNQEQSFPSQQSNVAPVDQTQIVQIFMAKLDEKEAKIEELNQRIIELSTKLAKVHPEGLDTVKPASIKPASSRKTLSVSSDNAHSQK